MRAPPALAVEPLAMRRLVKSIRSKKAETPVNSDDRDLTGMKTAELRALAAQLHQEINRSSAYLAHVETQIAVGECGRVRGRALSLQQRLHPPVLHRPESGTSIGTDLQIYHDCDDGDFSVRQRGYSGSTAEAPFPFVIEVYQFDGSFLSIVQNLPDDLVQGAGDQDIIELSFAISSEIDSEVFLRLNILHGPNESQLTRSCRTTARRQVQSFDLAEAELSHRSVERIWINVIFPDPAMNQIVVSDLIVRRRVRAQV